MIKIVGKLTENDIKGKTEMIYNTVIPFPRLKLEGKSLEDINNELQNNIQIENKTSGATAIEVKLI